MANLKVWVRVLLAVFAISCAVSCASKIGYEAAPARRNPAPAPLPLLQGRVQTAEGWLDLVTISDRPVVLVFSQDTCNVCGHEADALRASVNGVAPSKVKLVTVLVGAVLQDAQDWKDDHQVPWSVGIDPDSKVFASYCSERTVPCNVVFVPGKGIVFNQNAPATPEELQQLTGPWGDGS